MPLTSDVLEGRAEELADAYEANAVANGGEAFDSETYDLIKESCLSMLTVIAAMLTTDMTVNPDTGDVT